MRRRRGWAAVVAAVALAASAPAHAQAGSGAQTGSAGASDVAGLSADIVAVVRAERVLNRLRRGAGDVLQLEPQRELLGIGEDGVGVDLAAQLQTWWARNVFEPMLRLARNRAAS